MSEATAVAEAARVLLQGAVFSKSVPEPRLLPPDEGLEVAFAGRSNSGKSSALNVLCSQRALARTSRTPGRTQQLVVFDLDDGRRLVDLPGFGYAKVSKSMRAHWERALPEYLERRRSLAGLVLLMDVRHPLKPQETVMVRWCATAGVPLHILLNKADKLGRGAGSAALNTVRRHLAAEGGDKASAQLFSALRREGLETAWGVIGAWLGGRADGGA
ncbi:MAG: ribosome biogenesis GTP-binding protein YihA/YsxC [Gammaproteobacteria bacterium]